MSGYVLLRKSSATLLAESPLIKASDVSRIGTLADLIAELEAEKDAVEVARDDAREAGRNQGRVEGRLEGLEEARVEAGTRLGEALRMLSMEQERIRNDAVSLAVAVARRLLPEAGNEKLLLRLAERAVAELADEHPMLIRVCPEDYMTVKGAFADLGMPVEPDERLVRGRIVVETERGSAEAGLEARLDTLRAALEQRDE